MLESHSFLRLYHVKLVHADADITLIVIVETCKLLSYKHANKILYYAFCIFHSYQEQRHQKFSTNLFQNTAL